MTATDHRLRLFQKQLASQGASTDETSIEGETLYSDSGQDFESLRHRWPALEKIPTGRTASLIRFRPHEWGHRKVISWQVDDENMTENAQQIPK